MITLTHSVSVALRKPRPIGKKWLLDYVVPPQLSRKIRVGQSVLVPLGEAQVQGVVMQQWKTFSPPMEKRLSLVGIGDSQSHWPLRHGLRLRSFSRREGLPLGKTASLLQNTSPVKSYEGYRFSGEYTGRSQKARELYQRLQGGTDHQSNGKKILGPLYEKLRKQGMLHHTRHHEAKEKNAKTSISNNLLSQRIREEAKNRCVACIFPSPLEAEQWHKQLSEEGVRSYLWKASMGKREQERMLKVLRGNRQGVVIGTPRLWWAPMSGKISLHVVRPEALFREHEIRMSALMHPLRKESSKYRQCLWSYSGHGKNTKTLRDLKPKKTHLLQIQKGEILTPGALEAIQKGTPESPTLIYYNRKGYSRAVVCDSCGYQPVSPVTGYPLVLHQPTKREPYLACHVSHQKYPYETRCSQCKEGIMRGSGMGIEQVREIIESHMNPQELLILEHGLLKTEEERERALDLLLKEKSPSVILSTDLMLPLLHWRQYGSSIILDADQLLSIPDPMVELSALRRLNHLRILASESTLIIQSRNPQASIWGETVLSPMTRAQAQQFCLPPYARKRLYKISGREKPRLWKQAQALQKALQQWYRERGHISHIILRDTSLPNQTHRLQIVVEVFARVYPPEGEVRETRYAQEARSGERWYG